MKFPKFNQILEAAYSGIGSPQQNVVQTPQQTSSPITNTQAPSGQTPAPLTQPQPIQPQAQIPGVQPGTINIDPNTNKIIQNVLAKQQQRMQLTPEEQKLLAVYNQKLQIQNQQAQRAAGVVSRIQ